MKSEKFTTITMRLPVDQKVKLEEIRDEWQRRDPARRTTLADAFRVAVDLGLERMTEQRSR